MYVHTYAKSLGRDKESWYDLSIPLLKAFMIDNHEI